MNRIKANRKRKRLSVEARLGQRGINLIEDIVLEMGSRWIPGGPLEIGIDGYIELFDPGKGESLGRTLAVQSKAVSEFAADTNESFTYHCNPRDIDYWMQGNIPVILVVSRPSTKEAYWIPIKSYFTLNWNNTQFDGGEPITVRAARRVGDILKHVSETGKIQNRFRFYM